MTRPLITLVFLLIISFSFGQNAKEIETIKWLEKNRIILNSPKTPSGFKHDLNCGEIQSFKRVNGDTIIIYSRGSRIAESLERMKEIINQKNIKKIYYPTTVQKNGTVLIQFLRKWTFLKRDDKLFILDEYNDKKLKEHLKIIDDFLNKRVSQTEYKTRVQINDKKDYGFKPKFKMIFFKGIFERSSDHLFLENQNFRKEKVSLINKWIENDQTFYEINLETKTAGKFIISEDFEFINTEKCND